MYWSGLTNSHAMKLGLHVFDVDDARMREWTGRPAIAVRIEAGGNLELALTWAETVQLADFLVAAIAEHMPKLDER